MIDIIKKKIIDVQNDYSLLDKSAQNSMSLFIKHDLVLTGKNYNRIYAVELLYMFDVPAEEYLSQITFICDEIGLKCFNANICDDFSNHEIEIRDFVIELSN